MNSDNNRALFIAVEDFCSCHVVDCVEVRKVNSSPGSDGWMSLLSCRFNNTDMCATSRTHVPRQPRTRVMLILKAKEQQYGPAPLDDFCCKARATPNPDHTSSAAVTIRPTLCQHYLKHVVAYFSTTGLPLSGPVPPLNKIFSCVSYHTTMQTKLRKPNTISVQDQYTSSRKQSVVAFTTRACFGWVWRVVGLSGGEVVVWYNGSVCPMP